MAEAKWALINGSSTIFSATACHRGPGQRAMHHDDAQPQVGITQELFTSPTRMPVTVAEVPQLVGECFILMNSAIVIGIPVRSDRTATRQENPGE